MSLRIAVCIGALSVLSFVTLLAGCGSAPSAGSTTSSGPIQLVSGGASNTYAIQVTYTGNSNSGYTAVSTMLGFSLSADGVTTPISTLTLPTDFDATSIAVDPNSGTIYVGGQTYSGAEEGTYLIYAYAAGASGNATPLRMITTSILQVMGIWTYMTVDQAGQLYLLTGIDLTPLVTVYSPTASGTATPVRQFSAGVYAPWAIAIDNSQNVYVLSQDANTPVNGTNIRTGIINEYPSTGSGTLAPLRTITDGANYFLGITVDANDNLYLTRMTTNSANPGAGDINPTVVEYAAGATAAATPTKTISGSLTGFYSLGAIKVDSKGNLYVGNANGSTAGTYYLLGFAPTATGNAAPVLSLSSSTWGGSGSGLQFDIK